MTKIPKERNNEKKGSFHFGSGFQKCHDFEGMDVFSLWSAKSRREEHKKDGGEIEPLRLCPGLLNTLTGPTSYLLPSPSNAIIVYIHLGVICLLDWRLHCLCDDAITEEKVCLMIPV